MASPFDWEDAPEFSQDPTVKHKNPWEDRRLCYACGDPTLPWAGVCERHELLLQHTLDSGISKFATYLTGR